MFVTVKTDSHIEKGKFVKHDTENIWILATSLSSSIGVVNSSYQDENNVWWSKIYMFGSCFALCGELLPDVGGFLSINSEGKAILGDSNNNCGFIPPLSKGSQTRSPGDLIIVCLK